MKMLGILLTLTLTTLGPASAPVAALAGQSRDEGRDMYNSLRTMALRTRAADLGFHESGPEPAIFGIVMDMDIDGETATLVSFETGDASLYLSTGGGMIGGGTHRTVAGASRRFVASARALLASMRRTESFPRPGRGDATFYVLTTGGVFAATRSEDGLAQGGDPFSASFSLGQDVLSQLRLTQPSE